MGNGEGEGITGNRRGLQECGTGGEVTGQWVPCRGYWAESTVWRVAGGAVSRVNCCRKATSTTPPPCADNSRRSQSENKNDRQQQQ